MWQPSFTQKTKRFSLILMAKNEKIAFSCVVDAKPHMEWQALLLMQSLIRNVHCQPKDIKIHCLPGVTQAFRDYAEKLGVDIFDIEPFKDSPYCNKIQQCFSGAFDGYDKVILSDCDMFFCSLPDISLDSVLSAKIVDLTNPPISILDNVFQSAGLKKPDQIEVDCALSSTEVTYGNNLNGGLYIINRKHLSDIGSVWKNHALWLLKHLDILTPVYKNHVDQIAMSMALSELGIKPNLLSSSDNFPIHLEEERLQVLSNKNIRVIHYHRHLLPDGRIKLTGLPEIDRQIILVNHDIETILRQDFDNELFWSMRYELFPDLGSGVASRGEILSFKQHLLLCSLEGFMDKQIIDIGCGDLELAKVFAFKTYTGYDLSTEALKIAKKQRPEWNFIQGSITDHPIDQADVVICLDVLIHQKTREEYLKLIKALVDSTRQRLIVSGYDSYPKGEYTSDICAYHEPLSKSLHELGGFNEIIVIGEYRGLSFIVADKNETGPALHQSDLPVNILEQIISHVDRRDLLRLIIDVSRKYLGFYTKTSIRAIEYPWTLDKINNVHPKKIADVGAGVSPLPMILAQNGYVVFTIDYHKTFRDLNQQDNWNEWGFLDYSQFDLTIKSYNIDILQFKPEDKFDLIYSVSVVEHMPRNVWKRFITWAATWLKPGGTLLLTLDLIPGSEMLWNLSEGVEVEKTSQHGSLKDFRNVLRKNGFYEKNFNVVREIPFSRTDVAFLECELVTRRPNIFQRILNLLYTIKGRGNT